MDGDIDYSRYSLEELREVESVIHRTRYPKNFANLMAEIETRQSERTNASAERSPPESSRGSTDGGGLFMFDLDFIGDQTREHIQEQGVDTSVWTAENVGAFGRSSTYALRLIFAEKEILLFSVLQWVAIGVAYLLWVQIIGWIPMEVWESESDLADIALNLVFLSWCFVCVVLAAYPIAVLTGAMGAAHFLREQGQPSTIASCLGLALPNSKKLWVFHIADGWLTVMRILDRLPRRNMGSGAVRAAREAAYYAWKVGTIAMPAALLTGKGLRAAGKESLSLVKARLGDVLKLRGGYSVACWLVGVTTYIGSIVFLLGVDAFDDPVHPMFAVYMWAGVPVLISVGIIKLFLRPVYVIASCKYYSDLLIQQGKPVEFKSLPGRGVSAFVAFAVLAVIVGFVFLFRQQLGLMDVLSHG